MFKPFRISSIYDRFSRLAPVTGRCILAGLTIGVMSCAHTPAERNTDKALKTAFKKDYPSLTPLQGPLNQQDMPHRVRHKPSGIILLYAPTGTFMMGSPESEAKRDANEVYRQVEISQGFYLGETEITVGQYIKVMGRDAVDRQAPYMDKNNNPITGISWVDAQAFVDQLNKRWGPGWHLPTEIQWEYACRAGTVTPFSFGENTTSELANYAHRYPYLGRVGARTDKNPVPVKSYPANPWGFYEMHGNVWEWTADLYHPNPDKPATVSDSAGFPRVIRGGSYTSSGALLRCAYRDGYPPLASLGPKYGLRVVRALQR